MARPGNRQLQGLVVGAVAAAAVIGFSMLALRSDRSATAGDPAAGSRGAESEQPAGSDPAARKSARTASAGAAGALDSAPAAAERSGDEPIWGGETPRREQIRIGSKDINVEWGDSAVPGSLAPGSDAAAPGAGTPEDPIPLDPNNLPKDVTPYFVAGGPVVLVPNNPVMDDSAPTAAQLQQLMAENVGPTPEEVARMREDALTQVNYPTEKESQRREASLQQLAETREEQLERLREHERLYGEPTPERLAEMIRQRDEIEAQLP